MGARFFPALGGEMGWLVQKEIKFSGHIVPFSYRAKSVGDRGVIAQVFNDQDYRIDNWVQGRALKLYFDNLTKKESPLVIDAGANIGAASVYFSATYPGCKVVAIEPERNNCKLFRLNCVGRDVEIIEGAIGRETGSMFLQDPGLSDWGFRIGATGNYEVMVTTVPELLASQIGNTPFILKIDIEGGEDDLFSSDCAWLARFALVVIETHDWMLPGHGISQHFYTQIAKRDFDILQKGENTFCFNNALLGEWYRRV